MPPSPLIPSRGIVASRVTGFTLALIVGRVVPTIPANLISGKLFVSKWSSTLHAEVDFQFRVTGEVGPPRAASAWIGLTPSFPAEMQSARPRVESQNLAFSSRSSMDLPSWLPVWPPKLHERTNGFEPAT